jgi:hypothetical protein
MTASPLDRDGDKDRRTAPPPERTFTFKAIFCGFLGAAIINAFTQFNEDRLHGTPLVGNHMPIVIYFFLLLAVLGWNPLIGRWSRRRMFQSGELAVMFTLMSFSAWIPGAGLYRYFLRQIIMPWSYYAARVDMQSGVMQQLPPTIFPLGDRVQEGEVIADLATRRDTVELYEKVYNGFLNGAGNGVDFVPLARLREVFAYWEPALLYYWAPLLLFFTLAIVAMAVIVHRQWARHEQLAYPLAVITTHFIRRERGRLLPDIFYSRMFLAAAAIVCLVQFMRLGAVWFPYLITAPTLSWWLPLGEVFPTTNLTGTTWMLSGGTLYFLLIGICYFTAAEISFTLGVTQILLVSVWCQYYLATGERLNGMDWENWRAGAYLGYALILLYTGRDYYGRVVRAAFFNFSPAPSDRTAVGAARCLLLGVSGLTLVLIYGFGLDWVVAPLLVLMTLMLFLSFTRIICETGAPYLDASWFPGTFMARSLGATFLGSKALVICHYLSTIFVQDPRECLMPFVANSLKVAEDNKVRVRPLLFYGAVALTLAFVIGFIANFAAMYSFGAYDDAWASSWPPQQPFAQAASDIATMKARGTLAAADAAHGVEKLAQLTVTPRAATFGLLGLGGVILFSGLRFRFLWWPLHPVLFLTWGATAITRTHYAFLLGWAIKSLIVYFGGGKVYHQLRPLFIGLIVGELVAATCGAIAGMIYYFVTGLRPEPFVVYPG